MYQHLLVPLDGSRLAEAALPVAGYLARTLHARLTLLHIIEENPPERIHGEPHLQDAQEAQEYLKDAARRLLPGLPDVEEHVHRQGEKDVARSLATHMEELDADLIVMSTHGRSGVRSLLIGNIAQQVISISKTPILLVPSGGEQAAQTFTCHRIVTPLDGNPEHEQGLEVAASLARACGAELRLIMAVHTLQTLPGEHGATARLLPTASSAILDLNEAQAEEYLRQHEQKLNEAGIKVSSQVCRGEPVKMVERAARSMDADLLVLSTHGKSGIEAFWSRSFAPNLARIARHPILFVPV